jgi:hypothetical protein
VEGGPVEQILSGISVFWWSVTDVGIFLITRESEFDAIDQYNRTTESDLMMVDDFK